MTRTPRPTISSPKETLLPLLIGLVATAAFACATASSARAAEVLPVTNLEPTALFRHPTIYRAGPGHQIQILFSQTNFGSKAGRILSISLPNATPSGGSAALIGGVVTPFAGNGQSCEPFSTDKCGDGGLATDASLSRVVGIAVDNTTGLVVVVQSDGRIRMITRDRKIVTIARLNEPTVKPNEVAPQIVDGAVFVAGENFKIGKEVVVRVKLNGEVTTYLGEGSVDVTEVLASALKNDENLTNRHASFPASTIRFQSAYEPIQSLSVSPTYGLLVTLPHQLFITSLTNNPQESKITSILPRERGKHQGIFGKINGRTVVIYEKGPHFELYTANISPVLKGEFKGFVDNSYLGDFSQIYDGSFLGVDFAGYGQSKILLLTGIMLGQPTIPGSNSTLITEAKNTIEHAPILQEIAREERARGVPIRSFLATLPKELVDELANFFHETALQQWTTALSARIKALDGKPLVTIPD